MRLPVSSRRRPHLGVFFDENAFAFDLKEPAVVVYVDCIFIVF